MVANSGARLRGNLIDLYGNERGEEMYRVYLDQPEEDRGPFRERLAITAAQACRHRLPARLKYRSGVADPETFLRDRFYLGLGDELYPAVVPHFVELNSGKYVEALLVGGIGSAKTSIALWTCAYQLYLLSMMRDPHAEFGIAKADEIVIIFQSLTAQLARSVDYERFSALIRRSPYFQRHFPPERGVRNELRFPDRIVVKPVSGSSVAAIGQNVIGGLIDELNYAAVIANSKKVLGGGVDNHVYDQAVEQYNAISRRRMSRFFEQGSLPGILCLVSSKKYPGQFTDQKEAERAKEIAEKGTSAIFLYDKRVWDIKPWAFGKERFKVFIGDEFRRPRILAEGERIAAGDKSLVIDIPVDLRKEFERDIGNALREIAGVSYVSKSPFFGNSERLRGAFVERPSIFSADVTDFHGLKLRVIRKNIVRPELPRWAHVDLGLNGDSAGVAIGHCCGFVTVTSEGAAYMMPRIVYDGVLEVRPPKGGEIEFARIRKIFFLLRDLGMNVKWVSYDSWQSRDSLQILHQQGFLTGPRSIDKSMVPAELFKSAIYDGRVDIPWQPKLYEECRDVQVDFREQKVDHLPGKSKDLFDAACGVCHGLTTSRAIWATYEVPVVNFVQRAALESAPTLKAAKRAAED